MRLVMLQGPGFGSGQTQSNIFELENNLQRPALKIGRHVSNDIILADASVSRQHTEIEVRAEGLLVRDLGSSNGTYINRAKLTTDVPAFLQLGAELRIGNVIMVLEGERVAAPAFVQVGPPPTAKFVPLPPGEPQKSSAVVRKEKGRSEPNWFLVGVLLGLIILGLLVLGFLGYEALRGV